MLWDEFFYCGSQRMKKEGKFDQKHSFGVFDYYFRRQLWPD